MAYLPGQQRLPGDTSVLLHARVQRPVAPFRGLPTTQSQAVALPALQPLCRRLSAHAPADYDGRPTDHGGTGVWQGEAGFPLLGHIAFF